MQLLFFLMKQLYDWSDEPNYNYVLDIYRSVSYKAVRIRMYVLIIQLCILGIEQRNQYFLP